MILKNIQNFSHKLIVICLCCVLFTLETKAQEIAVMPSKEQIKQLKEKYSLSKIKITKETDGFTYYWCVSKDSKKGNVGALDIKGNVLIPFKYNKITYYPRLTKGVSNVPRYYVLLKEKYPDFLLQHPECNSAFVGVCDNKVDVINDQGIIIKSYIANNYSYLPGYFIIDAKTVDKDCFQNLFLRIEDAKAIITQNGRELATGFKKFDFLLKHPFCKYEKICNDGIKRMGVAHLYNQGLDIPCDYYNITYDKKDGEYSFKVMSSSVGDWELYTPSNINITQYRDKGEQLFAQEKYSEAIEYYKDSLMTSPIAKLYTGISLNKLANRQILYIPLFCESVEGGSYFKVDAIRKKYEEEVFDTKLAMQYAQTSQQLLQMYLAEHSNYARMAKIYCEDSRYLIEKKIPSMEERYNSACQTIGEYNNARREKIASALSGIVSGLFKNVVAQPSKGSITNSSIQQKSIEGQEQHTNNDGLSNKVLDRIRQVEQNLKHEEEYLQHAEERYKSNPTSVARMEISAHKKAIAGYKKQIEELKQ